MPNGYWAFLRIVDFCQHHCENNSQFIETVTTTIEGETTNE